MAKEFSSQKLARRWAIGLLHFFTLSAFASGVYVVKKGDTLSRIAKKVIPGPVYSKYGSLAKIRAWNPEIKNPNLIFPGDAVAVTPPNSSRVLAAVSPEKSDSPSRGVPEGQAASPISALDKNPGNQADFEITPSFSMANISATDPLNGTTASVATSADFNADIAYFQEWSESTKSFLHLGIGFVSFQQPTNSADTLSGGTKFLSDIGIGAVFDVSPGFHLIGRADYASALFLRGETTTSLSMDVVNVPSIGISAEKDLIVHSGKTLGVSVSGQADLPASSTGYDVNFGESYGAALYLNQSNSLGSELFETSLGVTRRAQNTTIVNQVETDLELSLQIPFCIGCRDAGR